MTTSPGGLLRRVGLRSATALVVANIIGAGIFTTTGFQALDLGHPGWILALWIVGGALAFCGALCYAELGAAMPEAGGEYVYLRDTFGGFFGFSSAIVSLVAGFSAPIAVAAKGFAKYLGHFFPGLSDAPQFFGFLASSDLVAIVLVWLLVAIHTRGVRGGFGFNDFVTLLKVVGIVLIITAAAAFGDGDASNLTSVSEVYTEMAPSARFAAFGTSLIFVMFCYSGWNASAYIAAEMKNPERDLPRSLLLGTGLVVVLYLGLNAVYFYGAPASELAGKTEVGLVAARRLFGDLGATLVTTVVCVSILASASAMTIAGPRVYYAVGRDFPALRFLSLTSRSTGAPSVALMTQGVATTIIILSGAIDQIMAYAGFSLALFSSLAVACVLVLRWRRPGLARPFRAKGYPVTPLVFLAASAWMMYSALVERRWESLLALATVLAAGALFYAAARWEKSQNAG